MGWAGVGGGEDEITQKRFFPFPSQIFSVPLYSGEVRRTPVKERNHKENQEEGKQKL